MKKIFTRLTFFGLLIVYLSLLSNRSGGPAGNTGAPGEETCGSSNCHNVTPNQGGATVNLDFNNGLSTFVSGETYTVNVSIDNPQNASRNGFQIVALDGQNANAGQWAISGDDKQMRSGNSRDYVTQSMAGSSQSSWEMQWTAPTADVDAITFYLAYNDVNANGGKSGDNVYTISLPINPVSSNAVANVVLDFTGMNPHVGQKLEARLIDKSTLKEVSRTSISEIAMPDFNLSLSGETGKSYFVDFYADLNKNGIYDAPPTDHAWRMEIDNITDGDNMLTFMHNTNFTDIAWKHLLTFDFTGMTPHVGQKLEVAVRDMNQAGKEVGRVSMEAIQTADFTLDLPFLEIGHSYAIDYYADLSKNGIYDAPPTDHAWRDMITDVSGDTQLSFSHNTNFTDVNWKQLLNFDFTGMTPHVGQKLEVAVRDMNQAGKEVGRVSMEAIQTADFTLDLPFLEIGHSYAIDYYADLSKNGIYDAPPTDHAWRDMIADVSGDTQLSFSHNTNFTDINWKQLLTLDFTGMNPHVGQQLEIRIRDVNQTGREVGRFTMPSIMVPDFSLELPYLEVGRTYFVDYYADLNKNGVYDTPPADHAWRDMISEAVGDVNLAISHNTNFTNIGSSGMFTMNFTNMNPHIGQLLEVRLLEMETTKEVERFKGVIAVPDFKIALPGLQEGKQYQVDFYADLNKNGVYDAPPADHAWRETFTAGVGSHEIDFTHNTSFTDVNWNYMMTLAATNMTPHLGQQLELKVLNTATNTEVGNFSMPSVMVPFFFVRVPGLKLGDDYNVDFYADLNKNGIYDAPPADHAWRVNFTDDEGDEVVTFEHNTDFTDIMFTTGINEIEALQQVQLYPNPFDQYLTIQLELANSQDLTIRLINSLGQEVKFLGQKKLPQGQSTLNFDKFYNLEKGFYFLQLQNSQGEVSTLPLIKR